MDLANAKFKAKTEIGNDPQHWLGSVVVGRRTCDREVAGSTPAAA